MKEQRMTDGRMGPLLNGASVTRTDIPCPVCAACDRRTVGGSTPTLRHLDSDTAESPRLFCLTHGWIEADPREEGAS